MSADYNPVSHDVWFEVNDRIVTIDGLKCRIRASQYKARYPYERYVVDVSAEPIDRNHPEYRRIRQELGDDWSTDVLQSEPELQVELLQQLGMLR